MSFLDHIRACNAHDPSRYRPFTVAGARVGWVRHAFAGRLGDFPDVFRVSADGVALSDALASAEARSAALVGVADALTAAGEAPKRMGELYPVATRFGGEPLLHLDRNFISLFGMRAYGLHVNGFVRDGAGHSLWIGRRAKDKPVAPGKLDNMVAGGQPSGLTLAENLRKEAQEEADLPDWLIDRARPVGALTYCFENDRGLKPDTLFVYDLEMPAGAVPRNTDGEIEDFRLMPAAEVAERVRGTDDFKFNVNLVIIDFLIRHGLLDPDSEPDYLDLVGNLRRPLP